MLKRFLKRFAKCIVCFSCVLGLLNVTNEPVKAVFIESAVSYGAVEIIGSMLVAGGAVFATSGEAYNVANSIWKGLTSSSSADDKDACNKILGMVQGILDMGGLSGIDVNAVFRLSKSLFDTIKSKYEDIFKNTSDDIESVQTSMTGFRTVVDCGLVADDRYYNKKSILLPYVYLDFNFANSNLNTLTYSQSVFTDNGTLYTYVYYNMHCDLCSEHDNCYQIIIDKYSSSFDYLSSDVKHNTLDSIYDVSFVLKSGFTPKLSFYDGSTGWYKKGYVYIDFYDCYGNHTNYYVNLLGQGYDYTSGDNFEKVYYGYYIPKSFLPAYTGTLTYPGEGLVIQAPDIPDSLPDTPSLPDIKLNPQDIVGDIPEEKLEDIAFDTPLPADEVGADIGTGTLPDVDEGEGEGTIPKPENPPDTDTDTGGILDILKDFFDSPSDFKLDFDAFKNIILLDRFPFCIPFDFIDSVKAFSVPAQDLKFTIAFDTKFLDVNHTVDLSPYQVPIKFFRATASLWFAVVLILKTRDLIKW